MPIKSLFILSLIVIITGCGDSEIAEAEREEVRQIARERNTEITKLKESTERLEQSISWVYTTECIRHISLHVPTKACIAGIEQAGGVWFNDSIIIFKNKAIDTTKAYTDEVYYTGELTFTDDNNKRDVLYLIYGHDFSHRIMNYENGKLNDMSSYVDRGGNPVLLEWYEDGVLTFQYSAAHEAKARGINYSDLCGPAAPELGGERSCGHIKFSEQEEGVSK